MSDWIELDCFFNQGKPLAMSTILGTLKSVQYKK